MARVGLLVPYLGFGGEAGFYNSQELGMAKAIAALRHEPVIIRSYRSHETPPDISQLDAGVTVTALPCHSVGTHALFRPSRLDAYRLDRLILMADVQAIVPWVDRWAASRRVPLTPYIGTIESDKGRNDAFARYIRARNLQVFRRRHCFVKTPVVKQVLQQAGVGRVTLMPVGLDRMALAEGLNRSREDATRMLGLESHGPTALFIGRLQPYKEPLEMVPVLKYLTAREAGWRVVVVGDGPLRRHLGQAFLEQGMQGVLRHHARIPQTEMWQVYRAADVLINLNPQEIFGMSILESLFYGTPVVAVDAPGPRFIIREGVDGFLVPRGKADLMAQRVVEAAAFDEAQSEQAHLGVLERFDWKTNIEQAGILTVES